MSPLLPRLEFMAQSLVRRQRLCPHCGAGTHDPLARKFGVIRIKRCRDCRLCFTDPIYRAAFHADPRDELCVSVAPGAGPDLRGRLRRMRRVAAGNELLELGSSWGAFLYQAERQGFRATGVEVSERHRDYGTSALGLDIVAGLDELTGRRFDVIYTAHTLEHFTDISSVFQTLLDLLRPGGWLVLEVPHFAFASRGKAALSTMGAVHPMGFTNEFFRTNLPRHGFRVLGFWDSWSEFPEHPRARSNGDDIICAATRGPL